MEEPLGESQPGSSNADGGNGVQLIETIAYSIIQSQRGTCNRGLCEAAYEGSPMGQPPRKSRKKFQPIPPKQSHFTTWRI